MRARAAMVWMNAAWREAVRVREAFVDVDHLLLGLVAAGGPAARLLADHGFTLTTGRRAAVAERAQQLVVDLPRGGGEREYLVSLLAEPSGLARRVVAWAGVDVDALEEEVATSAAVWRTPAPARVEALMTAGHGQHVSALRLEHYVSAPVDLVRSVAGGHELGAAWLTGPEDAPALVDARHQDDAETSDGERVVLALTVATASRVRFELRRGAYRCGAYSLDLHERSGGTVVVFTRELVTSRALGALVMPGVRFVTGLGMPTMIQNLSFACADALEQDQR